VEARPVFSSSEHTPWLSTGILAPVDLDIWIEPVAENADRVWAGLAAFGAPLHALGIDKSDLTSRDVVAQLGLPPNRIDLLTGLSGLTFDAAWPNRIEATVDGVRVPVIGLNDLKANKLASGRGKDLSDLRGIDGKT
jgi:hypothetical protein